MEPGPALKAILDVEGIPQSQSPLFRLLPPETRSRIWSLTLANSPSTDPALKYRPATPYIRPDYTAPMQTHTDVLLTCRAVLQESWFLLARNHEIVYYVATTNHIPPGEARRHKKLPYNVMNPPPPIYAGVGNLGSLHVFARALDVEQGRVIGPQWHKLYELPDSVTVTIRHADWAGWQWDEPLGLGAGWTHAFGKCLGESVREVRIELETAKRKEEQARRLAAQMLKRWHFARRDSKRLFADRVEESRWRGTSVWNNRRWTREETAPGEMHYVVMTVCFRLEEEMKTISRVANIMAGKRLLCECKLRLKLPGVAAPKSTESSLRCPREFPVPYPAWIQLPRIIMEAGDGECQDDTGHEDEEEDKVGDDCNCTQPYRARNLVSWEMTENYPQLEFPPVDGHFPLPDEDDGDL